MSIKDLIRGAAAEDKMFRAGMEAGRRAALHPLEAITHGALFNPTIEAKRAELRYKGNQNIDALENLQATNAARKAAQGLYFDADGRRKDPFALSEELDVLSQSVSPKEASLLQAEAQRQRALGFRNLVSFDPVGAFGQLQRAGVIDAGIKLTPAGDGLYNLTVPTGATQTINADELKNLTAATAIQLDDVERKIQTANQQALYKHNLTRQQAYLRNRLNKDEKRHEQVGSVAAHRAKKSGANSGAIGLDSERDVVTSLYAKPRPAPR